MLPQKLAFVDIETTGARASYDRILEIGVLRVENNTLVKKFTTLLNPDSYISPFIENLTGITATDVENAPLFYEIKEDLLEILSDCIFVAHNVRFDYAFIKNEFKRLGISFSSKQFCTVKLSRTLFPEFSHHNLDAVIERFNISCKNRHRAFDDAEVLWKFYKKLQKNISLEKLDSAIQIVMKKPSLPLKVPQEIIDNLPESPGVYIFYSAKQNVPLYIGKSINVRERVLSHFASDHLSTTEMSIRDQLEHIEIIPTGGELSALFREATLIKQMQPLYNRKLRLIHKLTILRQISDENGFYTVQIESVDTIRSDELDSIVGIFRSQKQAKTFLLAAAKEHLLCQKLLKLESGSVGKKRACFGYQLGNCRGACVGHEEVIKYNLRFLTAVSKHKCKSWSFSGPIIISEKNEINEMEEYFVIDKWCFLGSSSSQDLELNQISAEDYIFDLDTYKILVNYIFNPAKQKNIHIFHAPIVQNNLTSFKNVLKIQ